MKTALSELPAYTTKDGSEIRELLHPKLHGANNQSLAEATIQPGQSTQLHRHAITEEIYHVTQGEGRMRLGESEFPIRAGDTILILPGTAHQVSAGGKAVLKILCCCSPAYDHEDTEIICREN